MIFSSRKTHPIPQILSLALTKNPKTGIQFIDQLSATATFQQFSEEELNTLFNLLLKRKTLEELRNTYNFNTDISIESLLPILQESPTHIRNSVNIISFYVLRSIITFLSYHKSKCSYTNLKQIFQLLLFCISNSPPLNYLLLLQRSFLFLLLTFSSTLNSDFIDQLRNFFSIQTQISEEYLMTLAHLMETLLKQGNSDLDSFLYKLTAKFFLNESNIEAAKPKIMEAIFPLLLNLNAHAISFLASIIRKINYQDIEQFIQVIPNLLYHYYEVPYFPVPSIVDENKPPFEISLESIKETHFFSFNKVDLFDSSFNITFTPITINKDYFPVKLFQILEDLGTITEQFKKANETLTQRFIDLIEKESKETLNNYDKNKLFDISIMSLFVCCDNYLNLVIFRSKVFAPQITSFEYKQNHAKEFDEIVKVRSICIKNMKTLNDLIIHFLYSHYQFPFFASDLFDILKFNTVPNLSLIHEKQTKKLISELTEISGTFQAIHEKKSMNQADISQIRASILLYCLQFFIQHDNATFLIKNLLFMQMICSFMFEDKLRPIIISSLEIACLKTELDFSVCFSDFIKAMLHSDDKNMCHDLICFLNKIISNVPAYSKYFCDLCLPLTNSLSNTSDKTYMNNVINFVTLASDSSFEFVSNKIINLYHEIEGDEPSDETFTLMLNLMFGTDENKTYHYIKDREMINCDDYVIKNSKILFSFLSSFRKSIKFIAILKLLNECCSKYRDNAIRCHAGRLDLLLITIMKDHIDVDYQNYVQNQQQINLEKEHDIFIQIMRLFITIANVASSVHVIQSFFSLFNEIADNTVSKFHQFFYIMLNDLCKHQYLSEAFLPIKHQSPAIQTKGLTINMDDGISVMLLLYITNVYESKPKFFTITNDDQKTIELYMGNSDIFVSINRLEKVKINSSFIKANDWNRLLISFRNINQILTIRIIINDFITQNDSFSKAFDFGTNSVTIVFGGATSMNSKDDDSAIGFIGLYNLLEENEANILIASKKQFIQLPDENNSAIAKQIAAKTITIIEFINHNNCLSLSSESNNIKIVSTLLGQSISIPQNFKQVFIENNLFMLLFPLFRQLNYVSTDGNSVKSYHLLIHKVFSSLIVSNEKAQLLLLRSKAIDCLACVLSELPKYYSFYQQFFELFQAMTNDDLKTEIMGKILLNFNIWINADEDLQLQIYRDWSRTLNSKYNQYTKRHLTCISLLRNLRRFFWYHPIETNIIYINQALRKNREREGAQEKISNIRSSLLQIIHSIAHNHLTHHDLSILIVHIVSCRDYLQVIDLLKFLKLLIISPESPVFRFDNLWSELSRLHLLFFKNSKVPELVIKMVLDIFIISHYLNIIKAPKIALHVSMVIDLFPLNQMTSTFFVDFMPIALKYPEVMPLVFYLGMELSEREITILENNLIPDVKFSTPKLFYLYPLIYAMKFGRQHSDFVAHFLALSLHDNWDRIFQAKILLDYCFELNSDDFIFRFLCDVSKNILNTASLFHFKLLHNFFDVALFHIFFRKQGNMNLALNHLFEDSPFNDECETIIPKPKHSRAITNKVLFEQLCQKYNIIESRQSNYVFGLRFDESGNWLDSELAISLVQISFKTKVQTFHNASAILLAFLWKLKPNDQHIQSQIELLISKRVIDLPFSNFVTRIYQHPNSKSHSFECFDIFIKERIIVNKSILAQIPILAKKVRNLDQKTEKGIIQIHTICNHKQIIQHEWKEMKTHIITNQIMRKLHSKQWQANKDVIYTITYGQKYLEFKNENCDRIRENFYNDSDCPVVYKEYQIFDRNFRLSEQQHNPSLKLRKQHFAKNSSNAIAKRSTMQTIHVCSDDEEHLALPKFPSALFNEVSREKVAIYPIQHHPIIEEDALYFSQNNPYEKINVKFSIEGNLIKIISTDNFINNYDEFIASHPIVKNPFSFPYFPTPSNSNSTHSYYVIKEIAASDIKDIIFMPFKEISDAIQIITNCPKKAYYLSILSSPALLLLKKIASLIEFKSIHIQTQPCLLYFQSLHFTRKWEMGLISNFEYLMKLNKYSGRSFSNIDSYPIFPLLLRKGDDYNLEPRDLAKPIDPNLPVSNSDSVISLLRMRPPFTHSLKLNSIDSGSILEFSSSSNDSSFTINATNGCELTPEFYYDAKFFTTKDDSPNSYRNNLEHIYNQRKLLEKSDISGYIDLIWGINQALYSKEAMVSLPYKLFKQPHSHQGTIQRETTVKLLYTHHDSNHDPIFTAFNKIHFSHEINSTNNLYSFVCIERKTGAVYHVSIDMNKLTSYSKDTWYKFKGNVYTSSMMKNRPYSRFNHFGTSLKSFLSLPSMPSVLSRQELDLNDITKDKNETANSDNNLFHLNIITTESLMISNLKLFVFQTGEMREFDQNNLSEVSLISADKQIIATAGRIDSNVTIYRNFIFQLSIPTYHDTITSLDVSSSFGIVSAVTDDGYLIVMIASGKRTGKIINTVNLNMNDKMKISPKKVLITKKWGFIVVYSDVQHFSESRNQSIAKIQLFSSNGDIIREIEINCLVKTWTTFSSSKDFDYVIFSNEKEEIFLFEAFYININQSYAQIGRKTINSIVVPPSSDYIFVFAKNGDVDIFPIII